MLYEKNIWIDFETQSVYDSLDQVPKDKVKNFVQIIPDYCEGIATCNARENLQLFNTYRKQGTLYIDWERHFWTNNPMTFLQSLTLNDWLHLFKQTFNSGAEVLYFLKYTWDLDYLDDVISSLYQDNVTIFYWGEDIQKNE